MLLSWKKKNQTNKLLLFQHHIIQYLKKTKLL